MNRVLSILLIIIAFAAQAQDSINFTQLKFKSIRGKEFLLYPKWNYERPCAIPEVFLDLHTALDTNYHDGALLTIDEQKAVPLDEMSYDTIEKYGKIEMGKYAAYILRYKYGSSPQYMYMYIYDKNGIKVGSFELARYDYGESGSSCLLSSIEMHKKKKKILILSCREFEGWSFNSEDEYWEYYGSDLIITSIDMKTMKVITKEFSGEKRIY